jgi:hypothetical protein
MLGEDDEEGVISFDADSDDEMAELFSFGADANNPEKEQMDYKEIMRSVMPVADEVTDDESIGDDSFIDLLEQQKEIMVVDPSTVNNKKDTDKEGRNEIDMQEILDWLDQDDERKDDEEELTFIEPPKPVSLESIFNKKSEESESPPPPPKFKSLEEAVKSPKSTLTQIRRLLEEENFAVAASVRPHLWCKVVCGKTLEETVKSSVADSFQQWEQSRQKHESPTNKKQKQQFNWIQSESSNLSSRIVMTLNGDAQLSQRALASILLNHYATTQKRDSSSEDEVDDNQDTNDETKDEKKGDCNETNLLDSNDPLLPPVACAILSTGIPKVGAAVMLSNIVPKVMPILALTNTERIDAANILHSQFYLLVCYHLPYLALHLDRYLSPEWYLESPTGLLPQSWLLSHLAGECGGAFINPRWLQCLWDLVLTSSNNSLRFFLVMAILEQHAEQLLLTTGEALKAAMKRSMSFNEYTSNDGFAIESEEETTNQQAVAWVHEWSDRAQTIWEATPMSVVRKLKQLEDKAVNDALIKRQEEAEERMKLKLEAQARAHQEAMEAERERKADEARLRLTRARLVAFYRQYNPGKESNIDKIMKTYGGRYDVLDAKLRQKYGVGFNPAMKPRKELSRKSRVVDFGKKKEDKSSPEKLKLREVAVRVDSSEVVSSICWSNEANRRNFTRIKETSKLDSERQGLLPLKYYLVDSRPEESVLEQGRFPTSVNLSPEILLDPDRLKEQEESLESLRGYVHICIMGEGYAALPQLYGHKITRGLTEFINEDDARDNNVALFLLKRGFPFVSIIDGGFAAAHAYLCREGPSVNLLPHNVLLDYNAEACLFGQFEKLHSSTGREKAQRKIQNLFDSSMVALTKNTMKIEKALASDEQHQEKSEQSGFARFFGGINDHPSKEMSGSSSQHSLKTFGKSKRLAESSTTQEAMLLSEESSSPNKPVDFTFLNPFARKTMEEQESNNLLKNESVDFDKSATLSQSSEDKKTQKVQRQIPNSFSIFKQGQGASPKKEENKPATAIPAKEVESAKLRFTGLGAKFNTSLKTKKGQSSFSMFGKSNEKKQEPTKLANHFAGFKNKMEKMKTEVFQDNKPNKSDEVTGSRIPEVHTTPKTKSKQGKPAAAAILPLEPTSKRLEVDGHAVEVKALTISTLQPRKSLSVEMSDNEIETFAKKKVFEGNGGNLDQHSCDPATLHALQVPLESKASEESRN